MTALADAVPDDAHRRAAETALATATREPPRGVEALGRGNRKLTRLVRFDDRSPVVLQLSPDRHRLGTESALLAGIRERTEVPVPRVLASGATDGVAFLVTAYVEGADLHERFTGLASRTQRAVSRAFGRHLGALHEAFAFEGYGALAVANESTGDEDGALAARSGNWHEWFVEYGRSAVDRLPAAFDAVREDLRGVLDAHPRDQSPSPRLFPWDFRPGNALVADGGVTAVLDWEAPKAAAPALSAAKAEYLVADWYVDDPEPLRSAFVAGYERVREYPTVRPAHRVAAIADSAVDSTGAVTNPRYPELDREAAVAFHRSRLAECL